MKLASWDMLTDHHERGALFIVNGQLDMAVVGAAISFNLT